MKIEVRDGVQVLTEVLNKDLHEGTFKVPNDVAVIGREAFVHCTQQLTHVHTSNVTTIEERAFFSCIALTHIVMPRVTTIGRYAFAYCSVADVAMPQVGTIESFAFHACNSLIHVVMPRVTTIAPHAFYYCSTLTRIDMPCVTTIQQFAFWYCDVLTRISMSTSITNIEKNAFLGCKNLSQIIIMDKNLKPEEQKRIRTLLPDPLRPYALFKSQEVEWALEKFCLACPKLIRSLYNMRKNITVPSLAVMAHYAEPEEVSQLRKELVAVPLPNNDADFNDYKNQLQDIKEQHIARYIRKTAVIELKEYLRLLKRVHPDGFMASSEVREKGLQATLKKIINFLKTEAPANLSAEEKQWINRRKRLLQIIPQQTQEKLEISQGPAPQKQIRR